MRFAFVLVVFFSVFTRGQRSEFDHIDFKKADSIATVHNGASLKNLPVLIHKLTASLQTDVEKFRAIYTWVSTNIENDYSAYLTTRKKRKKMVENREAFLEWNTSFTPKVFKKLIDDRKTACTGYAYLIREMASLAGFNCKIVNGFGRTPTLRLDSESTPNHSWNIVEINNKSYLCDATWSAGHVMLEENGPEFQNDYFDGYFLADPNLFIKNHYPVDINSTLLTPPLSFKEFIQGPVIYKGAFTAPIIPLSPKKMHFEVLKNEKVSFSLQVPNDFKKENIYLVFNNGSSDKKVIPKITLIENKCTLQHTLEKTGLYDVHIKVDNANVATYVVKVKRK